MLYSGTGVGTYFYDQSSKCPKDKGEYKALEQVPICSKQTGPRKRTLRQLNSNNVVAIDVSLLTRNKATLCGKKVLVFYNGTQVAAPNGGDFFVWDGCATCKAPPGGIDLSLSGLKNAYADACNIDKVPCISWAVVDEQVYGYTP